MLPTFIFLIIIIIGPQLIPKRLIQRWVQNYRTVLKFVFWLPWVLQLLLFLSVLIFLTFMERLDFYYTDFHRFMQVILPANNGLILINLVMTFMPSYVENKVELFVVRSLLFLSACFFWLMTFVSQLTS
jgi:hypothetical protein